MHSTVIDPQVWQRWHHARQLTVLVAFEDSSTGTRIKEFRQDLSRRLGQHCRVIEHVWLFNMFRLRELREIAAEEAAAADVVVVAMHNSEQLSDEVKAWIDLWLQHQGERKPLLLALLEPAREGAARTIATCLQDAVREGGNELLVESWSESEAR
jgi:hypothetical protein